jgi:hypothetical protein
MTAHRFESVDSAKAPLKQSCEVIAMNLQWKSVNDGTKRLVRSIFLLVDSEKKLLEFLFDPKEPRIRKRPGILRDEAQEFFNESEQLAIRVALDLWSGSGHVYLFELVETWEEDDWIRFVRAISALKSLPGKTIC